MISARVRVGEVVAEVGAAAYVRTLWRPTMNATLRLQGLTKDDQLVSMVRYSPLRAHILSGAYSNGCPAN